MWLSPQLCAPRAATHQRRRQQCGYDCTLVSSLRQRNVLQPTGPVSKRLSLASSPESGVSTAQASKPMTSVALPGSTILADVQLDLMAGRGGKGQAVVVVAVKNGSESQMAGITVGQRIAAVSDPMRNGVMWELNDRPSLRFVLDALRMSRNSPLPMKLEAIMSPMEVQELMISRRRAANLASGDDDSPGASNDEATGSISSYDTDTEGDVAGLTIGERLARKYDASQQAAKELSDVQRRIARRASYMDEVNQRDDSGLGLLLAGAFLGPAAIILGIAFATGYMDKLYSNALTFQ